jgi:hypothetical protein
MRFQHANVGAVLLSLPLMLLVSPAHSQLGGSIMASPGDLLLPPELFPPDMGDAIPPQPVPPLSVDDWLPIVPYLDPVAQYVGAWHELSVGAQRAARDLTQVLETLAESLDVATRHRQEMSDAAPWILRIFLQQAMRL